MLYSHFGNRDAIVAAVAVEGFRELAIEIRSAAEGSPSGRTALANAAAVYLGYARANPAVYEAMFTMPTGLRFAEPDTRPELKDAFAALAAVVAPGAVSDVPLATEVFWATLHGLAELERSGRIRLGAREERLALVIDGLSDPEARGRHPSADMIGVLAKPPSGKPA